MKIVVAGSSGLVGSVLVPRLRAEGHEVVRLVRSAVSGPDEVRWVPSEGRLDPQALGDVDAVINLCGSNIAAGRWTPERKRELRSSRLDSTRTLAGALAGAAARPRVLVNASAIGFYGSRGGEVLIEQSPKGEGFLPDLCAEWEQAAQAARSPSTRVVCLRIGIVLSGRGGALARMVPIYKAGLGGRIGDGRAWMSWISSEDLVRIILFVLGEASIEGPVNAVSPESVHNELFSSTLAAALKRHSLLPVPAALLRLVYGEMAEETLLASVRVLPSVLREKGFVYRFPDLPGALLDTLG